MCKDTDFFMKVKRVKQKYRSVLQNSQKLTSPSGLNSGGEGLDELLGVEKLLWGVMPEFELSTSWRTSLRKPFII